MKTIRTLLMGLALAALVACVPAGGGGGGGSDGDGGVAGNIPGDNNDNGGNNNNGGNNQGNPNADFDYAETGADPADTVADLDDEQIRNTCAAYEAWGNEMVGDQLAVEVACIGIGLFAGIFDMGDPVGTCESTIEQCLASPEDVMEEPGDPCPLEVNPECTASLEDITACIEARVVALRAFAASFECALIDEILMGNDPGGAEAADDPACAAVEAACPNFFGDDDEE